VCGGLPFLPYGAARADSQPDSGEILAQVLLPLEEHKAQIAPQTNIVLMGQGEPLLNFEPVMEAVRILLDPRGWEFRQST